MTTPTSRWKRADIINLAGIVISSISVIVLAIGTGISYFQGKTSAEPAPTVTSSDNCENIHVEGNENPIFNCGVMGDIQ